jgi:hypothetical protein
MMKVGRDRQIAIMQRFAEVEGWMARAAYQCGEMARALEHQRVARDIYVEIVGLRDGRE